MGVMSFYHLWQKTLNVVCDNENKHNIWYNQEKERGILKWK